MITATRPSAPNPARNLTAIPDVDNEVIKWLLSVAAGEHKHKYSSQQVLSSTEPYELHAIVDRCSEIIMDEHSHVYERGLAVMALGRTLGREIGKTSTTLPRGAASVENLRQVNTCCRGCLACSLSGCKRQLTEL